MTIKNKLRKETNLHGKIIYSCPERRVTVGESRKGAKTVLTVLYI